MSTWVIGADNPTGIGRHIADQLDGTGREVCCTGKEVDVTSRRDIHNWLDVWQPDRGKAEVVYCAGANALNWIGNINGYSDLEQVFNVNVMGFIRVCDELVRYGFLGLRMVAISSDAAVRPLRTSIAYCSSKAALNMAVRVAARELAPRYGWRVNAVAPGVVDGTPMTKYVDHTVPRLRGWTPQSARQYEESQAVLKGRAMPEEIAAVVEFVLDAPSHLNGAIIPVNGGR